jgi:signal transduction histidine kinase/CheY-like chemotaxis protein
MLTSKQIRMYSIFNRTGILFSVMIVCCFLFPLSSFSQLPVAKKGVIDLRSIDLSKQSVPLDGEWGLCWEKLCEPGDSSEQMTGMTTFPKRWDNTIIGGKKITAKGYASYMLTILLPQNASNLALDVPDTYTSYKLFVDDAVFVQSGKPGISAETTIPKWQQFTRELFIKKDTIKLIFQVANFLHSKGGPYKSITIGNKEKLFTKRNRDNAFNYILTGSIIMCGLFFFGLYFFGRYDKTILYFALFCITYSYRIIGTSQYSLHTVFPNLPWALTIHMEYLSLFVSVVFFTQYTQNLYPEDSNKIITTIEMWACIILSLITLIFPPSVFTQLINPFLVVMFFVIGHAFYVYIIAYRRKRLGAGFALLSTGVVLIIFIIINLQYFNIVAPQKELLFVGYLSFFFLQSLILSYRYSYFLNKARKEAEQGLVAKSDFLSNMSHEIRTPLNSVIGLSHILLDNQPREDQKEQLNVLLFSANNLLNIVNDILDYNKIEAGKINFEYIDMDLVQVSQDLLSGLKTLADEKGISLILEKDPAFHHRIISDPTRISQVIGNLLQNAIKFTRSGHVKLIIQQEKIQKQHITLTIKVEDTGIGIAAEKQKLIFDRFTQADTSTSRSFGGTGLGLAICKKILELQGSQLQLKSEPGKGSVFFFTQTFPISQAFNFSQGETIPDDIEKGRPLSGVSLLMAEDNELNVLVAKTFLEKWGAKIDVAVNGEEAVRKLDINKHQIILMDMHMPVMDGYEAVKIIRNKGINIPIIALTASLPSEVEERARDLSINAIVTKPFEPDEFLKLLIKIRHQ